MSAAPLASSSLSAARLATEGGIALLALAGGVAAGSRLAAPPGWELGIALSAVVTLSWQAVWFVLAALDRRTLLSTWRGWSQGKPLPYLPYTQPGSPAERAADELGLFFAWARRVLLPRHGEALLVLAMSVATALVVSAALGERAVALTFTALALAQGALLLSWRGALPSALQGLHGVTLPLLLGHSLMAAPGTTFIAVALALGVAYGGVLGSSARLRDVGCVAVVLLLTLTRQPIGAFTVLVLWAPQALLSLTRGHRAWLVAVVLATALTFAA